MNTPTARRRIGIGLVSAGWMGKVHSRAYLAVRDKYPDLAIDPDLVVVADTVEANARVAATQFGYRETTDDVRAVLDHPDVDVVSICAPNYLHREFALAAAEAGKPFWIEKPMGITRQESLDIVEAAERAHLRTAVGFSYRHAPAVAHARELIRTGRIGRVTNLRCRFDADYSSSPDGPRTWRFVRDKAGSGVLGDLLSHGFDLAHYLLGPITHVTAMTKTVVERRPSPGDGVGHDVRAADDGSTLPVENEDYAAVMARFAGGAVGTFESTRVGVGPQCDYGIEVYGTRGSIRWNFERMNEIEICEADAPTYGYTRMMTSPACGEFGRFQPGPGLGLGFDDLKTVEAALFLASVVEDTPLAPSVADGLAAATLVALAGESAVDGTWREVPTPRGETTFDL